MVTMAAPSSNHLCLCHRLGSISGSIWCLLRRRCFLPSNFLSKSSTSFRCLACSSSNFFLSSSSCAFLFSSNLIAQTPSHSSFTLPVVTKGHRYSLRCLLQGQRTVTRLWQSCGSLHGPLWHSLLHRWPHDISLLHWFLQLSISSFSSEVPVVKEWQGR